MVCYRCSGSCRKRDGFGVGEKMNRLLKSRHRGLDSIDDRFFVMISVTICVLGDQTENMSI